MNYAQSNITKTYIYMALLSALVGGVAYLVSVYLGYGSYGVAISFLVIALINFFSFTSSDRLVLAISKAQKADKAMYPSVYSLLEKTAQAAQIKTPDLYIIDDSALNAFATGRDPQHASVALTRGILALSPNELEGVLAHELSHIKNYDTLLMTIVALMVSFLSLASHSFYFQGGRRDNENNGSGIFAIIAIIVTPIIGTIIQLAISRQREFLADASAASLSGNRGLLKALIKISSSQPIKDVNPAISHLYIANPLPKKMVSLFSTHPPIEERIARLEEMG